MMVNLNLGIKATGHFLAMPAVLNRYVVCVNNHYKLLLPLNDYFTMLSLLVSSSQWRGRGRGESSLLLGNRQFKIQYQKNTNQIKIIKTKTKLLSVQYKQGQSGPVQFVHWLNDSNTGVRYSFVPAGHIRDKLGIQGPVHFFSLK